MSEATDNLDVALRTLIVEDCTFDAECLTIALWKVPSPLECVVISTAEELKTSLDRHFPELILADHNLINWTAADVLEMVRDSGQDIPVIVVTGALGDERAAEYIKRGASDYVLKDNLDRLPFVVETAIQERARRLEHARLLECRARISEELRKTESLLVNVMHAIPDPIWLKDTDGVLLACNASFEKLMGVIRSEAIGKNTYELMPREVLEQVRERDRIAMASGVPCNNEEWIVSQANGRRTLYETSKSAIRDESGKVTGIVAIARDITERFNTEQELRIAACAFEAQEGILITNANHVVLRANRALQEMTGYNAEELIGRSVRDLESNRQDPGIRDQMLEQLTHDDIWQGEVWNRRKSGEVYPGWLTVSTVRNREGAVTNHVGMLLDISAQKRAASEIERLAYYDVLTGLPNRRLLIDRLRHALAALRRKDTMAAFYFIDLDNFKFLNDSLGHDAGDTFLVEVAKRISNCVRESDSIARLGGDEFAVLVEDLDADRAKAALDATMIGEKLLETLGRPYLLSQTPRSCSASIGLTLVDDPSTPVEELLKQADIALYQAKHAGRATLRPFDAAMRAAFSERTALEQSLRNAIIGDEFTFVFQPQVDSDFRIVGAEALLRWNSSALGPVEPDRFIPLAEETGLILSIGDWVLQSACRQLSTWSRDPRLRDLFLAINVSARQFHEDAFASKVKDALVTANAPPERLVLELTESIMIRDFVDIAAQMALLKSIGVAISIDDFGTGFSSLAYLANFPLNQLKIDRSFVQKLPGVANDGEVVRAILGLGTNLGLSVVAEGVESEAQYRFLVEQGCSTFQGFYCGRPVPVAEFEKMVQFVHALTEHLHSSGERIEVPN